MRWPRRDVMALPLAGVVAGLKVEHGMADDVANVIDDLSEEAPLARNGASWELVLDGVMGGMSKGTMRREVVAGREAIRLRGDVSLENNGGFVQMALDLAADGRAIDARAFEGLELDVVGNGESYNLHLRTADVTRPWQSYRQSFVAGPAWHTHRLPFRAFTPHRLDAPLDLQRLRRLGIVAIGRAFRADVAIARIAFYAEG